MDLCVLETVSATPRWVYAVVIKARPLVFGMETAAADAPSLSTALKFRRVWSLVQQTKLGSAAEWARARKAIANAVTTW